MSLQDVKNDILQEGRRKADEIDEETQRQVDEIVEEAEEKSEEIKRKAEEEVEEEKELERRKSLSNARMEAKQKKLEVRQEKLEEVFETFRQNLSDLEAGEKKSFVKSAVDSAEFEVGKVVGSEGFEDAVDVQFESSDVDGFIVVSEDGERRKDFTLDRVVENFKSSYRKHVAEKLFEK